MAIASATQVGRTVQVKDERGRVLFSKTGTLKGYTGTTVSVQLSPNFPSITTFDEKGRVLYSSVGR